MIRFALSPFNYIWDILSKGCFLMSIFNRHCGRCNGVVFHSTFTAASMSPLSSLNECGADDDVGSKRSLPPPCNHTLNMLRWSNIDTACSVLPTQILIGVPLYMTNYTRKDANICSFLLTCPIDRLIYSSSSSHDY